MECPTGMALCNRSRHIVRDKNLYFTLLGNSHIQIMAITLCYVLTIVDIRAPRRYRKGKTVEMMTRSP